MDRMKDLYGKNQRNCLLDIAKTVGILGVVLQHARGWAYSSDLIYRSLLFAVGLFVMIGGYNAIGSYIRNGRFAVGRKLLGIIIPYVTATVIYCVYALRPFDINQLLHHLVHFSAMAPLYYVAVYAQLTVITPALIILLRWCQRKGIMRYIISWLLILCVCYLTTNYTNILGIIIGGGNLFAGPWLMFWYAGMMYGVPSHSCNRTVSSASYPAKARSIYKLILIIDSLLIVLWHYLFVFKDLNAYLEPIFGGDQVLITWAHVLEVLLIFTWFLITSRLTTSYFNASQPASSQLSDNESAGARNRHFNPSWTDRILSILAFPGRHSLYIFLYHVLFLEIYVTYIFNRLLKVSGRLNQLVFLVFITGCPVAVEYIFTALKQALYALKLRSGSPSDTLH